jgi:hypothetical protein
MKKKETNSQSAFFYLRVSIGLLLVLAGVALTLLGIGQFPAHAQQRNSSSTAGINPLVPAGFDCAQFYALGYHIQENLRAGAIAIYCGQAIGGSPDAEGAPMSFAEELLAPLLGGTDVDLISPQTDAGTHITQSETFVSASTDDPNTIVVAYNDSRNVAASPINISSASVSSDGGATFTRLTKANGHSPFENTLGDPVVLYNSASGTFFTVWLDIGCGGQGLGGYKSATPADPNSWTHFCVHTGSSDDRESGYADNFASSPFNGNMYVSWNNFADGGSLRVRSSTDNGLTWGNERQLAPASPFIRDVQITGDADGTLYVAGMNEMNGGLTNRANKIYKSTDGGLTWANTYTGPTFSAPGRTTCPNSFFACMFITAGNQGYWRHQGWGQPAAHDGIVSYVYDSRNTANGDPGDVFYIRSTDGGVTFSAPFKLNTDSTTKAQWQPNISAAEDGSLLAVWYDERLATQTCVKSSTTVPCYQMWGRKSTDGGVTWGADEAFSDVVSPLPGQPDFNIVTEYVGDYDYSNHVGNTHLHPWTDGRVAINNLSQQDAFFDQEGGGGGGGITLTALLEQRNGESRVTLTWDPADGGTINVLRNSKIVQTTPDDGSTKDKLGTHTGNFTYQVCETDSGDCSNEVVVMVQ